MTSLGVYVHFPWCRVRCPYCSFAIAVGEVAHERYRDKVLWELALRAPRFTGRTLRSIYFGGGTPSLWRADCLAAVVREVRAVFPGPGDLEITVEANPNDCTPEVLEGLLAAGANRLSIGAQAFDEESLVFLGRDHRAEHARTACAAARRAGFANVSLDLIYALPSRTMADWRRTLATAVAAEPDHLSVYQLTVEPKTTLWQAVHTGRVVPAPDDDAADQFEAAHEVLGAAGYEHYEVSSYARPGRRARHNSLYWQGVEYLGLGNAAHSFWRPDEDRGQRWSNHLSVVRYLADDDPVAEQTMDDAAQLARDAVMVGLRTSDGMAAAILDPARVARAAAAGLLVVEGDRVRPTVRGLLQADGLTSYLLDAPTQTPRTS